MRSLPVIFAVALVGCRSDNGLEPFAPVEITLDAPAYGSFHGHDPIEVRGHVTPTDAVVKVEGERVEVARDGSFATTVPFDRRWRVVDVEGAAGPNYQRVRVPVFDGQDPIASWPGGMTARITPAALDHVGASLGGMIDGTGWDDQIAAGLPSIDTTTFRFVPVGVSHAPTTVVLAPDLTGIHVGARIDDLTVDYTASVNVLGTWLDAPVSLGFGQVMITALATPVLDDQGMLSLDVGSPEVDMGDPIVQVFGSDVGLIETIVGLAVDGLVVPIADMLGNVLLGQFQSVPLGGPFVYDTTLMGMDVDVRLSDVYTDPAGVGAGVGIGLDEPAPTDTFDIPAPVGGPANEHLLLGVHEGVFQMAVDNLGILDMLNQDIQLPGAFGEIIGMGVRALPGGDSAPQGDGWCLKLDPNPQDQPAPAQVVRISTDGIDPIATMYLPDLGVNVGIAQNGVCTPWLDASVSAELGIRVTNGTTVGIDVHFVDGAVLNYAATTPWDEAGVITGLDRFLEGAMGLLGGQLQFDIGSLLGGFTVDPSQDPYGLMSGLQPAIVSARPLLGHDGQPVEGMAQIGLQLWADQ